MNDDKIKKIAITINGETLNVSVPLLITLQNVFLDAAIYNRENVSPSSLYRDYISVFCKLRSIMCAEEI